MGNYWGHHWCSLEKGIFKISPSELPEVKKFSFVNQIYYYRTEMNLIKL